MAHLNKQQLEAINTIEGQLLILAGAGSGKTTVLVQRIIEMLKRGIPAEHLLTLTFTNKAANELKERIVKELGEEVASKMWSSNFHSMCVRILRRHGQHSTKITNSNFTIYDNSDSINLVKDIVKEMGFDIKKVVPKNIYYAISMLKNEMVDAQSYSELKPSNSYIDWEKAKKVMQKVVREEDRLLFKSIFKKYEERLLQYNGVDFDDIILHTIDLFLSNEVILKKYQNLFQYISVDEYQDTNHSQYVLVKLLAEKHKNLAVVGDDSQAIYSFRGADIRNILNFEKEYKNAKVVTLEQNYRSTDVILKAANQVISKNNTQLKKELFTEKKNGEKITSQQVYDEYEEARFVAREIERRIRKGHKYGDVAILSRTNSQTRPIEQEFIQQGIQYKVIGGLRFFDRKEIKDMVTYIRFILNPNDLLAFQRIVNFPKRGIGKTSIEKISDAAKSTTLDNVLGNLDEIKLTKKARIALEDMMELMKEIRKQKEVSNADDILQFLIENIGIKEELDRENDEKRDERKQNISQLVNMAADMVYTGKGKSLDDFADIVSLYSDQDEVKDDDDVVKLMTVHASKGLEFPIVFVIGMEEGIFPHDRSLQEDDVEEERRLMYVAMTRAQEKLYLVNAQYRRIFGQMEAMEYSRFLEEFSFSLLD